MPDDEEEEKAIRSVALQSAQSIFLARQRAERELVAAKEALERKSEELAQQREWFRVTLASIGDAVITTDTGGEITFLNPVAEALTGWKLADAAGQPVEKVFKIIDEDTRQPVPNPLDKVLRDGVIVGLANHTTLIAKDGHETAVEDSAAPIRDGEGRIIGAVMVFHDVTAGRRASNALAERARLAVLRAEISTALVSGDDLSAVLQKCTEALVKHLSAAFARIWTLNEAEGVLELNASAGLYTHLDGPHGRVKMGELKIGRIAQSAQPLMTNDVLHDPNISDPAWARNEGMVAFAGYPLLLEGTVLGVVAVFARHPFSKEVFGELAPITEAISQWVKRKRAEDSLRGARDAAESANRAKDEFLAALSHELRTPLAPVLMLAADMEKSAELPAAVRADFAMIRKNVELEARIIDDLLDLTRITHGKLALRFETVEVHGLIEHALAILRSDHAAKNIAVALDLAAAAHHVSGDAVRLQQVFWNVIKNAIKFTPHGGRIAIRSWNEHGHLRVTTTDTGFGITAEEMPRIFAAFEQGREAASSRFGGLGLGLSISAVLVREHRGRIWAESAGRDQGSMFHLELPPGAAPAATEPAPPSASTSSAHSLRILLVEDHDDTRGILVRLMTRWGHSVTTAGSVTHASDVIASGDFDLLLSDLGLPDGTGYDVIAALREKSDAPAVAMSGYGMEADRERTHDAGFAEHIVKPVAAEQLRDLLDRLSTRAASLTTPRS